MATAILKFVRLSPQKGRLVADLVRGLPVERALEILQFSTKGAAVLVKKVLESAIANAEHNDGADVDELKVQSICIDAGPMLKRFHARAKGRGARILKRTSHITVTVGDAKKAAQPVRKSEGKAAKGGAGAAKKAAPKARAKKTTKAAAAATA